MNGDDQDLIKASGAGDLDAFEALVLRHQAAVRAFLIVRIGQREDADDLAQETFMTAFRRIAECDPARPFYPWLRGIAFNLLRNYQREKQTVAVGDSETLASLLQVRIGERATSREDDTRLEKLQVCLARMDEPSRQLLQLRYSDERPLDQICQTLNLKHSTVTMRLHRLREALLQCMGCGEAGVAE